MCPYSCAVHVVLTEVSLCSVSLLLCCMSVVVKAFRDDVKAVLDKDGVICKDLEEMEELKGIRRESAFTAEYNGIHVATMCVHTSSDLNINHVQIMAEAKQVTGSTKGLLISNQSTIPSECLLTLEDAGCQFVPVGGYGEEGWEDRMIDKFKGVFSKLANDDSKVTFLHFDSTLYKVMFDMIHYLSLHIHIIYVYSPTSPSPRMLMLLQSCLLSKTNNRVR